MNHHIERVGKRGSMLLICAVTLFYYVAIEYRSLAMLEISDRFGMIER